MNIRCTKNFDMDSIFLVKIGRYPLLHFLLNHLYFGVIEPVDTNIVTRPGSTNFFSPIISVHELCEPFHPLMSWAEA